MLSLSGSASISIPSGRQTDLTVEASIVAASVISPNPSRFRIYNPNEATISALKGKEFQTLTWQAGYENNIGLIYSGDVKQSIYAHAENVVDSYIDIWAVEHGNAHQQARVSSTLAAGWTPKDKLQLALDAMKPFGITGLGLVNVDLGSPKYSRARPFSGMARNLIRDVALSLGATCSMSRGLVHIIDHEQAVETGGPIVLNSKTGLVGYAQRTENGIIARVLINPAIWINTQVKIDESSIIDAEQNNNPLTGPASTQNMNLMNTGRIAADGIYRVLFVEIEASTRAAPWFMVLTCLAISASPNESQIHMGFT
ncbi:hypothetical protein [Lichenibacterium dinghuense]|uniref:hypothetical protein n=1 Tax=Lichenibacterium dinghuense TaxID=2895977 RepID=UPI001F23CDC9|nr:hypothetical protein [Lichenibacterium sp. 6Y81]